MVRTGVSLPDQVAAAVVWLLNQSHLLRPESLPAAADHATRMAGGGGCRLPDHRRSTLAGAAKLCWGRCERADAERELLHVDGSVAGRAYRDTETMPSVDGTRLWVPLLDGTERLGVLELLVEPADGPALGEQVAPLASLIAELVVSKGQYTDSYERIGPRCRWACPPRCCGGTSRR